MNELTTQTPARDEAVQVAKAFVNAKRAFSPALKTSTNPHLKSKYADLAACLEAVNEALLANGIAVIQETFTDGAGITVETIFLHESGATLRGGKLHIPAPKQDPQGYGSALTYARRYSLMTACGIAPEDDDGHAAAVSISADYQQAVRDEWCGIVMDCKTLPDLDQKRREGTAAFKALKDKEGYKQFRAAVAETCELLKESEAANAQ